MIVLYIKTYKNLLRVYSLFKARACVSRAQVKCYTFFSLLMSPNEHPNVGWVNLVSATEKIYLHICGH